jgi:dolichol-phosphate mannosyltransferase
MNPKTLIIIPTYNERENIERMLTAVHAAVPQAEILVVDDGSPDGTGDLVEARGRVDGRIHLLRRSGKLGLGTAYLAGFAFALEGDYQRVFEMDADFSHDPKYLQPMIDASENADMVIGSRYVEGGGTVDWGLSRRLISRGGGIYARTILGLDIQDLTAGFVCYRRDALEKIALGEVFSTGYCFQIELKYRVHRAGLRLREIPIVFPDRVAGVSKMSAEIAREALVQVLRLKWKLG